YDGLHRPTVIEDNDSRVDYFYDLMGHLRKEILTVGSKSRSAPSEFLQGTSSTTEYGFDGMGVRRQVKYPNGEVFITEPDPLNRPKKIYRPGQESSPIAEYTYVGGRRYEDSYENGTKITRLYDGAARLEKITQTKGSTTLTGFLYQHDREGNRKFEQPYNSSGVLQNGSVYEYDSIYRLTKADHNISSTSLASVSFNTAGSTGLSNVSKHDYFSYDKAGSRTSHTRDGGTATSYTQTTADGDRNQYSTVAGLNQTHDDNGNLTVSALGGSNNENRKFDESNMLVELERPGDNLEVAYRYDATGRRITKEIDDNGSLKTIEYAYSGAEVIQEYAAGTGVENKTFVYGPGIDNPIYMDAATSGTSYFGTNSIGSITALSNSSGTLLESYEYRPFGEETIKNASGTVISGTAYANPFMFTARRKDYEEGSDLYHFRTRQYSAITGRFISHDSLGDWGSAMNRGSGMAYCNNNPINWRDPFGLDGEDDDSVLDWWWTGVKVLYTPLRKVVEYGENEIKEKVENCKAGVKLLQGDASGVKDLIDKRILKPLEEIVKDPKVALPKYKEGVETGEAWADGDYDKVACNTADLIFDLTLFWFGSRSIFPKGRIKSPGKKANSSIKNGNCFLAGTLVATPNGDAPIEELEVGQKVLSKDKGENVENEEMPTKDWLKIIARIPAREDGESCDEDGELILLRSPEWLDKNYDSDTNTVFASSREVSFPGWLPVIAINKIESLEIGAGQTVLTTVSGPSRNVFQLKCIESSQLIKGTGNHPIWSVDRNKWVELSDLKVGEKLEASTGYTTVEYVECLPGSFRVFNLEVRGVHNYLVGRSKILVHNGTKTSGSSGHTPGRGHQRKSLPQKKKRAQKKAKNKRNAKIEAYDKKWREWNKLSEEVRKLKELKHPGKPPKGWEPPSDCPGE
ncbi:MAG: polymorphic toxin-type HINT domain-containing protein, partial [Planctomycetota bacterium]|nr:polymorphic toxin-type HINT domain-containing protein [Planctomycetota bacterium]